MIVGLANGFIRAGKAVLAGTGTYSGRFWQVQFGTGWYKSLNLDINNFYNQEIKIEVICYFHSSFSGFDRLR